MKDNIRRFGALIMAALLVAVSTCTVAFAEWTNGAISGGVPSGVNITAEEWEVLRLTNHERAMNGVEPLTAFPKLQSAADVREEELTQVFAHQRPDGTSCFTVFAEFGMNYSFVGENIAAGYRDAEEVVEGWMNSEGHRANILSSEFDHVGIGRETADTYYGIYWVQLFYSSFNCQYTSMSFIMPPSTSFNPGTPIDDMGVIAVLHCSSCGDCYLPVSADFCTGFDADVPGTQTIRVSCCGVSATFDVEIAGGSTAPTGDVDGDGEVTVTDSLLTMRCAMELLQFDSAQLDAADMDENGSVDMNDAIVIMRRALNVP